MKEKVVRHFSMLTKFVRNCISLWADGGGAEGWCRKKKELMETNLDQIKALTLYRNIKMPENRPNASLQ